MDDYWVIKRIHFTEPIKSTGKTVHYRGNNQLPPPFSLVIVQYHHDEGYYLFYLDVNGEIQTDTYHDTLQAAMDQAKWEYNVAEADWDASGG